MRFASLSCLSSVALAIGGIGATPMALAQTATAAPTPASAAVPAATPKYSTTKTPIGTLMADPAAKAVLTKHIAQLVNGGDAIEQASGMTLKELQGALKAYAPDLLSDKKLQDIDTDLAALPAK